MTSINKSNTGRTLASGVRARLLPLPMAVAVTPNKLLVLAPAEGGVDCAVVMPSRLLFDRSMDRNLVSARALTLTGVPTPSRLLSASTFAVEPLRSPVRGAVRDAPEPDVTKPPLEGRAEARASPPGPCAVAGRPSGRESKPTPAAGPAAAVGVGAATEEGAAKKLPCACAPGVVSGCRATRGGRRGGG
jgi:hypothetical protein